MMNSLLPFFLLVFATQAAYSGDSRDRLTAGDLVRAELVTEASDFSSPFMIGVRFRIDDGWNLYWKNPGDAGLPIEVTWVLPEGFSAGPLQLPTPEKIVHDGVIAYGYTDEVLLLSRITPRPGYTAIDDETIAADLDYLVCRERCLAGNMTVSLTLNDKTARSGPDHHHLFGEFTSRLPRPVSDIGISAGKPQLTDRTLITIPFHGTALSDFYPEQIPDFVIDYSSIRIEGGTISMHVTPSEESASLREIRGLVIAGGRGYELVVPVPPRAGGSR
jgi:DsbC/DsbD-like thiol-disulfide interchange protein